MTLKRGIILFSAIYWAFLSVALIIAAGLIVQILIIKFLN